MDSADTSDFTLPDDGSRLLSESLPIPSAGSSRTGHGGDDLSLSELSLTDRHQPGLARRRPFSLLAQPSQDESVIDDEEHEGGLDGTMTQEDIESARRLSAKTREEKLQHDLFILKKLNTAFDVYKDALRQTKSSTERVAGQLVHTNALLDKYVNILSKSENVTKLLLDERWEGAEADEEQLEKERQEELERLRREEEEHVLAAQRERERLEREKREVSEREERERIAREKAESAKVSSRGSGVRGVRGTRASMRGMRGVSRGASSTRGGGIAASSSISSTLAGKRSASTGLVRGAGSSRGGIPRKV